MMKRRAKGEGTIYRRKDDNCILVTLLLGLYNCLGGR